MIGRISKDTMQMKKDGRKRATTARGDDDEVKEKGGWMDGWMGTQLIAHVARARG